METKKDQRIVNIIQDADGKIIGRTRLQKIAYLLELARLNDGERFYFDYYHYGPYSEEVADATTLACFLEDVKEEIKETQEGNTYAIYSLINTDDDRSPASETVNIRKQLIQKTKEVNSIELELAATAAYFADKKESDPWGKTKEKKSYKARGRRLDKAKELYEELCAIAVNLPKIN